MDGENGYSPYDPFDPLCSPFDDYCGTDIGGGSIIIAPPPIVIIVNGTPADLSSVQNAINQQGKLNKDIITILGLIYGALKALLDLIKLLRKKWLDDVLPKLKKALEKIQRILDKILKPIRDALKAQRDAIMDIYTRFIRPLIVFLESIRRFIALLKIFHIHLLDKLDDQLAKLERRIMEPFLRALGRVNTISNWINFILNTRLLIFRNLFMRTQAANRGGSFSMFAGTPAYGFSMLPPAPQDQAGTIDRTDTHTTARAAVQSSLPGLLKKYAGTPVDDVVACWEQGIEDVDVRTAVDEMTACILASFPRSF